MSDLYLLPELIRFRVPVARWTHQSTDDVHSILDFHLVKGSREGDFFLVSGQLAGEGTVTTGQHDPIPRRRGGHSELDPLWSRDGLRENYP